MFRRNFLVNCVGDSRLDPVDGRKWKTGSTVATVGENPSAKGRLDVSPLVRTTFDKARMFGISADVIFQWNFCFDLINCFDLIK
jgi:hypothetical protein